VIEPRCSNKYQYNRRATTRSANHHYIDQQGSAGGPAAAVTPMFGEVGESPNLIVVLPKRLAGKTWHIEVFVAIVVIVERCHTHPISNPRVRSFLMSSKRDVCCSGDKDVEITRIVFVGTALFGYGSSSGRHSQKKRYIRPSL